MRKIVLMMQLSVDGFFEGPGRDISWHRVDEELHSHFNQYIAGAGALLSGRVTHQLMAGYWPNADADPTADPVTVEFARIWRDLPKVVFSRTLQHSDWHTTLVREVVPEDIRALKAQDGGDLLLGGADLTATFLRHDLVDEFRLYIHPVVVGGGRRLFGDTNPTLGLDLLQTRTFGNGVVLLRHGRAQPTGGQE